MSPPLPLRLKTLFILSTRRTDVFLTRLARLLSSSKGISATLCTLYYTLAVVHSQLLRLLTRRYEQLAETIAARASDALLPGESMIATLEPPHAGLTELCASVRAAGDAVNDARMFLRLWGLVKIYGRAKGVYVRPPRDPVIKTLEWAKLGMRTGYQVLENGAYLVRKGVLGGEKWKARGAEWWVWSNRFWFAYVVVEMLRLLRVRQLKFKEEHGTEAENEAEAKDGKDEGAVDSQELERRWIRKSYATAGWLPVSLHWARAEEMADPTDETWLGIYGLVPGLISLQDAWRETS